MPHVAPICQRHEHYDAADGVSSALRAAERRAPRRQGALFYELLYYMFTKFYRAVCRDTCRYAFISRRAPHMLLPRCLIIADAARR